MSRSKKSRELSQLLTLVFFLVTVAVLYFAKTVVVPLALAVLFSFLLSPLVTVLDRIHLPRVLAVLAVILAAGIAVGTIGWTVFNQLVEVTDHMTAYTYNINHKVEALNRTKSTSFSRAEEEVSRLGKQIGALNLNVFGKQQHEPKGLGASSSRPVAVREVSENGRLDTLHGVLGAAISVFLVVVFTFFMLLQREDLRNRLIRLTGRGHLNLMTQAMDEAGHRVSRYLGLQLLVNTCYGCVIFTALHFIGLPHAILWGALAALLRFVPYIGAPIAALLPTAFSVAVFHGWKQTLFIVAIFFALEITTANFIEPHVYGKQTGLSPLAILVAAVFWTLIWGPIGLILSIPLTVCLVVVGSHVPSLKFLTVLLGDQPVMRPEAHYYQRLLATDEQEASQVLETYLKDNSVAALYDSVLVPALSLFEQDRHRDVLDQETVNFVTETTQELVEEFGLRDHESEPTEVATEAGSNASLRVQADKNGKASSIAAQNVVCVPVRDDSDEIIALMLAQMLQDAGHSVRTIPLAARNQMLADVFKTTPDVVCLSALPPYAMSYARAIYQGLRARQPDLEILVGLWAYTGDLAKAAKVMTGESDRENKICTTLTMAVQAVTHPESTKQSQAASEVDVPAVRA